MHPLREFFTSVNDKSDAGAKFFNRGAAAKYAAGRSCLIVTVPDPLDSQFGAAFDQVVNVVQRALAAAPPGYVFDRAWLPWEVDKQLLSPRGKPVAKTREDYPGTLLFRSLDRKTGRVDVLVVFLVGENLTSGIDKKAFRNALRLIEEYGLAGTNKVRVVGPYFTGAQTSLLVAVGDWVGPRRAAIAATAVGTAAPTWSLAGPPGALPGLMASALAARRTEFELLSGSATGVSARVFRDVPGVTFRATVIRSEEVIRAVLHYLEHRSESRHDGPCDDSPRSVALLLESNTGLSKSTSHAWGRVNAYKLYKLTFPLHISRLRASAEHSRRLQEERLGLPPANPLIPALSEEGPVSEDIIPSQDPVTTAASNGKVLNDILSQIVREKIRYVGIVATDVRDKIFLASAVRNHCPGVQIFIVGSDQLLTLPENSFHLKGTIVGSTYPLFPANQHWTGQDGQGVKNRHSFPSESAQGCYNAVLALLGQPAEMVEYRPPVFDPEDPARHRPRPPIWVSMIGQNGDMVPLQFFTSYKDEDYVWQTPAGGNPQPAEPARAVRLALPGATAFALVGICLFSGWVLSRAYLNPSPRMFWWPQVGERPPLRFEEMVYRTVCLLALVFFLLPVAWLVWIYLQTHPAGHPDAGLALEKITRVLLWLPACIVCLLVGAMLWPLLGISLPAFSRGEVFSRAWWRWRFRGLLAAGHRGAAAAFSRVWWRGLSSRLGAARRRGAAAVFSRAWWRGRFRGLVAAGRRGAAAAFSRASWHGLFQAVSSPTWWSRLVSHQRVRLAAIYLFTTFALLALTLYLYNQQTEPPLTAFRALFWERATNFSSGVSPLFPLFFICLVFFCWAFFQLKRSYLFDRFTLASPYPSPEVGGSYSRTVGEVDQELRGDLEHSIQFVIHHWVTILLITLATLVIGLRVAALYLPTVEGRGWDRLFLAGFILGLFCVSVNTARFVLLWSRTRKLLEAIALVPMMQAFDRLPGRVANNFGGYLYSRRPRLAHLLVPVHLLGLLARAAGEYVTAGNLPQPAELDLRRLAAEASWLRHELTQELATTPRPARLPDWLRDWLTDFSRRLLLRLAPSWPSRPVEVVFAIAPSTAAAQDAPGASAGPTPPELPRDRWLSQAEGFIAVQVVIYLSQFFIQLRNFALSIVTCSSLLLIAGTCYPFYPERLLVFLLMGLVAVVVSSVLYVLVQINRNELVSRIVQTTPNQFTLDWGFVGSLFTYVIPALGILAIQASGAFRFIFEPILRVVR
jgi:hypothetical protein